MSNESKGDAYKEMEIEPWDVIISNFNPSAVRGYFVGETLAYLMRYNGDGNDRGGVKDLKKAQAFIERLIEYDESIEGVPCPGPVRALAHHRIGGVLPARIPGIDSRVAAAGGGGGQYATKGYAAYPNISE